MTNNKKLFLFRIIIILLINLSFSSCHRYLQFNELDVKKFNKSYYTEISNNSFKTDGVYYTFDSTDVYEFIYSSGRIEYRDKSSIDEFYPNHKSINRDTTYKAYFISLVWFTDKGKVFFSSHGNFFEGHSIGVRVIREDVNIDSLKHYLLFEKLSFNKDHTFLDNNLNHYYCSKGYYRINNKELLIKSRCHSQHHEYYYVQELEAAIVNDSTINFYINLHPIVGYHNFHYYKTDIQPPKQFMRITD